MTFFTSETVKFWKGLAKNNSKAWLDEHRKDYEKHLKAPYYQLAEALVEQVQEVEPEYTTPPKQAVYRINRDTRFANDKTPYKTRLGITIGRSQKHDPSWPAYTVSVGVEGIWVAGGLYHPSTDRRDLVRRYVGEHASELASLEKKPMLASTASFRDMPASTHSLPARGRKSATTSTAKTPAVNPVRR